MTFQEFTQAANARFNNKYTYIEDTFSSLHKPMTIICPEHGSFEQTPAYHLRRAKCGCPKCGLASRPPRKVITAGGRLGAKNITKKGYEIQCTAYRNCTDIDATFLCDGSVVKTTWAAFERGKVSHPNDMTGPTIKWTKEEIDILKAKYPSQGTEIPELLAQHTQEAIYGKAYKLGIKLLNAPSAWLEEECEILKAKYPTQGTNIPELLTRHSKGSIMKRAQILGIRSCARAPSKWTPEQAEILKKEYAEHGPHIPELAGIFTSGQIRSKAHTLGLSYDNNLRWTNEELEILREKYTKCGPQITELLAKHPASAIRTQANKLGLTKRSVTHGAPWTKEEDQILREKYPVLGCQIPELAHRAPNSIKARASKFQIPRRVVWTKEQEQILREKYPAQHANIPELLNYYTKAQIRSKASSIGASAHKIASMPWTNEELEIIKQKYAKCGSNIPELLGRRTRVSIINRAVALGLKKEKLYIFNSQIGDTIVAQNGFTVTLTKFLGRGQLTVTYLDGRLVKVGKHQWVEHSIPLPPLEKQDPKGCRGIFDYKIKNVTETDNDVYYAVEHIVTGEKNILTAAQIESQFTATR